MTRFRTRIKQYTGLRVQLFPDSIEQPPVGIDLFGVLLLEHEDDLHWHLSFSYTLFPAERTPYKIVWIARMRLHKLGSSVDRQLSSVLLFSFIPESCGYGKLTSKM
jgi:hypothetical protein